MKFPPFYTLVAAVLALILNALPLLEVGSRAFGGLVALAGLVLAGWAAYQFRGRRTPIHPGQAPAALITTGPFAFTRNPIYLGMILIVLGIGFSQGSLLGLLPAAGLWWLLDRDFAAPEEAALVTAFAEEGETYVARVRRWIGA
ncbi:methyltransferase family protein [Pseudaestuariivita sp.]|uniref:methyltransferase family protein n=1 Tax=Pseudaestuariivita sp. TaxID=2211669 RepID=UPI004058157A